MENKLVIREIMQDQGLNVTTLADKVKKIAEELKEEEYPTYRTIDQFIRRGSGNIKTAAPIARALNVTMDEMYIPKNKEYIRKSESKDEKDEFDICKHIDDGKEIDAIIALCIKLAKNRDPFEVVSKMAIAFGRCKYDAESIKCFQKAEELKEGLNNEQ